MCICCTSRSAAFSSLEVNDMHTNKYKYLKERKEEEIQETCGAKFLIYLGTENK
jgi:hypothetical protein